MTFILWADGRDDDVNDAFARYRAYLDSTKGLFPLSAFALASSDWYFDFRDHRCPHDAWLVSTTLSETASDDPQDQRRNISLRTRLLGAYHDGYIELEYPRVFSYTFSSTLIDRGHRDWRYDEIRLSDSGNIIHEIEWCGRTHTASWLIEASDVVFAWLPNPVQKS
jgi:hypothetical protein